MIRSTEANFDFKYCSNLQIRYDLPKGCQKCTSRLTTEKEGKTIFRN